MDKSKLMLKAMISRMPSEDEVMTVAPWDFLNTLKRIDNGWRLFVSVIRSITRTLGAIGY